MIDQDAERQTHHQQRLGEQAHKTLHPNPALNPVESQLQKCASAACTTKLGRQQHSITLQEPLKQQPANLPAHMLHTQLSSQHWVGKHMHHMRQMQILRQSHACMAQSAVQQPQAVIVGQLMAATGRSNRDEKKGAAHSMQCRGCSTVLRRKACRLQPCSKSLTWMTAV